MKVAKHSKDIIVKGLQYCYEGIVEIDFLKYGVSELIIHRIYQE